MKPTLTILLITVITGWFNSTIAQLPGSKTYTFQDNGLVSNSVKTIFQDSKGYMWFGTSEGVSQYDGYIFRNYSTTNGLSEGQVNDITEIDGKIFVGLLNGSVDCIENGKVTNLTKFPKNFSRFVRLPGQPVMALTQGSGVYCYQNNKFIQPEQETTSWQMNSLLPLSGGFYIGANLQSIYVVTSDLIPWLDTLINGGRFFSINSLYQDSKGRIWVCAGKGLFKLKIDLAEKKIRLDRPPLEFYPPSLDSSQVWSILEDSAGFFWIATTNGLVCVKPDGSSDIFHQGGGFLSEHVPAIFNDREKNVWFATSAGIIKITTQNKLNLLKIPEERTSKHLPLINSILPFGDEDLLFTNPRHQVYHTRTNSFSDLLPGDTIAYNYIVPGTRPILFYDVINIGYFDSINKKFILLNPKANSCQPFSIVAPNSCVDNKGIVFIGMQRGITAVSANKKWFNYTIPEWIYSMTVDKQGCLWVGTMMNAARKRYLYRVQYSFVNDSLVFFKKDYSHLIENTLVRKLFTDSYGNIWVGTHFKGVFCLTPRGKDDYESKVFNESSGLTSNNISSIAETSVGDILLGTSHGIDKLVREKTGFRVFNFSKVARLYGTVTSLVPASNNQWWCVINQQIVKFEDAGYEKMAPLPVEILHTRLGLLKDSIIIKGKDTAISLRYTQNSARFEFSAPGFINEEQVLYSYRLLGPGDTLWSTATNVHEVSYSSLQPGNYIFEVRTIGWNGEPGKTARSRFIIRTPFWKTTWFNFLIITIMAGIFYFLYRYRIRQLRRLQQVRNRIATDLHDDIGSTLTNISILTELSRRSKNEPDKSEVYLNRIREEIDASGQALDDIIWSVNSKNDSFSETAARMRRYAAEIFDARNIRYELNMDPQIADKKIIMEQRRDLFMIFKEVLNNIHKHAVASSVLISLFIEKDNIHLVVRDDGKGFDTSKQTNRNGISNIKERVNRWRGGLVVESANGKGTVINVRLPLSGVTQKGDRLF